jgi:sec-independent protein translocase protein TatA
MLNIGPQELLLVLLIALVVVGPRRLPELGRAIGRGLVEFRRMQDEVRDMVRFDLGDDGPSGAPRPRREASPPSPRGDRLPPTPGAEGDVAVEPPSGNGSGDAAPAARPAAGPTD